MIVKDTNTGISYDLGDLEPVVTVDSRDHNLAGRSSARWNEISLYENESGFIVVNIGRTTVDGEHDIYTVNIADDVPGVITSLRRRDKNGLLYFTKTAQQLISRIEDIYGSAAIRI